MIFREVVRYLLVGGLNTVATYALYLLLMRRIDYRAAYVLAFLAGIVLSAVLLRHVVFRRPGRRYANLYVAANYGLQLLLGSLVVSAWGEWMHGPVWLAPAVAIAVCVPLVFLLQRWVFTPYGKS